MYQVTSREYGFQIVPVSGIVGPRRWQLEFGCWENFEVPIQHAGMLEVECTGSPMIT